MTRFVMAGVIAFACVVLLLLCGVVGDAWGHSWYEPQCCSGKDCAPLPDEDVVEQSGGYFVKSRNEFIPFEKTRPGRDDQYHICVNEQTNFRLCFYRKFNGS